MRARLGAIAAVAGLAVAVVPAHAGSVTVSAGPTPQITDATGDANFVNGQSIITNAPSQSTPVDQASADIKSVLFQTTYVTKTMKFTVVKVVKKKKVKKTITISVKVPTGFTVTMNLAAAPGPETEYRVLATKGACASFFFEYSTDAVVDSGAGSGLLADPTQVRCASGEEKDSYTIAPATVQGSSITWTLPLSQVPNGTKFTNLTAQTTVNPLVITAPSYDTASSAASFTVGQ
ncbi:MAG: hypothetical protein QOG34_331 [Frankiaceae bacterium]|jgi:hypothetical protein|nr:hypothetical protein [Frankiaceae bacterium]